MKKFINIMLVSVMMLASTACAAQNKNLGTSVLNGIDTTYHDVKNAISTVYNDGKEAATALYPEVKQAIVAIGKAIGVAAEHVYTVLVKKYVVIGVKWALMLLGGLVLIVIGGRALYKLTKDGKPITYSIIAPALSFLIGLYMMFTVNYDEMLMGLINPEYGAINYILEFSKEFINN